MPKKLKKTLSAAEQQILEALQSGQGLSDALSPMIKNVMEAALEGEMEAHLEASKQQSSNRRNGKTTKRIKSSSGIFELDTPRDRDGSFEPEIIKKRQTVLTEDLDKKIINLYINGMSYSDIQSSIEDLYQVDISSGTISNITDRLLPEIESWRNRPLESVYTVLFLDAMHFKVREEGKVISKAVYSLLGVNQEGKKDILGLYINDSEGASFWAGVLASLKERGVQDILIACVDGLKGFPEAIEALFPKTAIQLCIIHQIRNSLRYVASKDQDAFMTDLKGVYKAPSKDAAENALRELDKKWGKKYPVVIRSWNDNWTHLSHYFCYDQHVRKMIYTTNAVEGLHRMVRKYTKSKAAFTSEKALIKLVYSAYMKILNKWKLPVANWALIVSQLDIHFKGRIKLNIA